MDQLTATNVPSSTDGRHLVSSPCSPLLSSYLAAAHTHNESTIVAHQLPQEQERLIANKLTLPQSNTMVENVFASSDSAAVVAPTEKHKARLLSASSSSSLPPPKKRKVSVDDDTDTTSVAVASAAVAVVVSSSGSTASTTASSMSSSSSTTLQLLAQDDDHMVLNPLHCFIRKQIEVFEATDVELSQPQPGRKVPIQRHQIGLRCIHCRHLRSNSIIVTTAAGTTTEQKQKKKTQRRVKRAVCYPSSVARIYHAVSDMKFDHFTHCTELPPDVRVTLERLKAESTTTNNKQSVRKIDSNVDVIHANSKVAAEAKTPTSKKNKRKTKVNSKKDGGSATQVATGSSSSSTAQHYHDAAVRMGMVDSSGGIFMDYRRTSTSSSGSPPPTTTPPMSSPAKSRRISDTSKRYVATDTVTTKTSGGQSSTVNGSALSTLPSAPSLQQITDLALLQWIQQQQQRQQQEQQQIENQRTIDASSEAGLSPTALSTLSNNLDLRSYVLNQLLLNTAVPLTMSDALTAQSSSLPPSAVAAGGGDGSTHASTMVAPSAPLSSTISSSKCLGSEPNTEVAAFKASCGAVPTQIRSDRSVKVDKRSTESQKVPREITHDGSKTKMTVPLSAPEDGNHLNPLHCFVRRHIELFAADDDDVSAPSPGRKARVVVGQVGLRCIHCTHLPAKDRVKRSVCYPPSVSGIYHAVSNMKFDHFAICKALPQSARDEFVALRDSCSRRGTAGNNCQRNKKMKSKSSGGGGSSSNNSSGSSTGSATTSTAQYYYESALNKGLVDSNDSGIRFLENRTLVVSDDVDSTNDDTPRDSSNDDSLDKKFLHQGNQSKDGSTGKTGTSSTTSGPNQSSSGYVTELRTSVPATVSPTEYKKPLTSLRGVSIDGKETFLLSGRKRQSNNDDYCENHYSAARTPTSAPVETTSSPFICSGLSALMMAASQAA